MLNTGDLEASANRFESETRARFENRGVDPMRPLLEPELLWLRTDELFSELKRWPRVQLKTDSLPDKAANTNLAYQPLPDLAVQAQNKSPLDNLRKFLETFTGPVIFSVESEGRREALGELLSRIKVAPKRILRLDEASGTGRYLMIGAAEHGFIDTLNNLALICESDLLGERVARRRQDSRRTINPDTLIRNLAELHPGQPIVHLEHGVGRYAGMTTLEAGGIKGEYLMLMYANDAKLYVPVSSLHLISRYAGGAEENAPCINSVVTPGRGRGRKRLKKSATWRQSCWISTPSVRRSLATPLNTIKSSTSCSATASRLKLPRIRPRQSMPC
ncbi:Transcription-repair-coupling factor [Leclercia adecarboxylata]|uniref:Transcription-repair-coupling factor n=1 Tax=Leclercia adecarboxylata TaxID=83655 RepID=A0A4U9HR20_9ENTR|nr:Transcription-repair-coupling factor [Leclercia adecarboxylata]